MTASVCLIMYGESIGFADVNVCDHRVVLELPPDPKTHGVLYQKLAAYHTRRIEAIGSRHGEPLLNRYKRFILTELFAHGKIDLGLMQIGLIDLDAQLTYDHELFEIACRVIINYAWFGGAGNY